LWRLLDNDGIVGNRSDLFRIKLIADRKHQLQIPMFSQGSSNGAEDIDPAIQYCAH
jgi:hypothetical protein